MTTKSQYGFQVLGRLVCRWRVDNSYVQIGELKSGGHTSARYLEQVLLPLADAGILESKRGQRGGYRLNRKPEEVSLAEVVRHLEGRLMPIPSWAEALTGDRAGLAKVLHQVRDTVRDILENTTIEVLAQSDKSCAEADRQRLEEAAEALMHYI